MGGYSSVVVRGSDRQGAETVVVEDKGRGKGKEQNLEKTIWGRRI